MEYKKMDEKLIIKLFLEKFPNVNMHYLKRYIKIICSTKQYTGILEKHHILPKSIWSEYDKTKLNHKYLSLKAHFLVHWILIKMLPNNEEMTYAFYYMCNRNENKNKSSRDFLNAKEQVRIGLKLINDERLSKGTHNFQGKSNPNVKKVSEGTHPWQGKRNPIHKRVASGDLSKWSKALAKEKVDKGIHVFQGERNPVHKMIKEGRHPSQNLEFKKLISNMNKQRVVNGTHKFFGAKPWTHYGATDTTINTWRRADIIKKIFEENPKFRYKKLFAYMKNNYKEESFSVCSMKKMVSWFDKEWNPEKDDEWLKFFKKSVDTKL